MSDPYELILNIKHIFIVLQGLSIGIILPSLVIVSIIFFVSSSKEKEKEKKKSLKKRGYIFLTLPFIIFLIATVGFAIANALYGLNLCKPGDKLGYSNIGYHPFCYTPSGFQGKPCNKSTDCRNAAGCALTTKLQWELATEKTKIMLAGSKGHCEDLIYGCNTWIDKEGNYNEKDEICVD